MSPKSHRRFKEKAERYNCDDMVANSSVASGTFTTGVHKIFCILDTDKDGNISHADLQQQMRNALGDKMSSGIVVQQLLHMVDADDDGIISEDELLKGIK